MEKNKDKTKAFVFLRISAKIKLPADAFEFLFWSKFWFYYDRNLLLTHRVFEKEKIKWGHWVYVSFYLGVQP